MMHLRCAASPIVFEVLSPGSAYMDCHVKVEEYAAVPTIRRYVILKSTKIGLTVRHRADAGEDWDITPLQTTGVLELPEIGNRKSRSAKSTKVWSSTTPTSIRADHKPGPASSAASLGACSISLGADAPSSTKPLRVSARDDH